MRGVYGLAMAAAVLMATANASAQSVTFDFEDGTDQGFGTGFGNDASAAWPIESVGGSNRMRVTRQAFQAAGREEGNAASPFYLAMLAASVDETLYELSYDWYVDTTLGTNPQSTFLQLGTYVNTGSGYYAQDFPGAGKDVELDGVQMASGGVFSGTVTETFAAKGFNMPLAETFFRIGVIINSDTGLSPVVHFDNIRVSPVIPEPASLALAGLGLLVVAAARRRSRVN